MDQDRLDELIDKYASGTISPEEFKELLDWYHSAEISTVEWPAANPEEKDQLKARMLLRLQTQIRAASAPPATRVTPAAPAIPATLENPAAPAPTPGKIFPLRPWQVAAAACLLLIISSIWLARQSRQSNPALVERRNPAGKIQTFRLPDGTQVWLNAVSTIRYSPNFGRSSREVYLDGEGYFDVTKDDTHPFIVHSGPLITTVLGTRFDVKAFRTEALAEVSVISGKVKVGDSTRVLDVLTAARQLKADARTGKSTTVTIDTTEIVGWRQGRLQFSGQTMEEIAASLGRWYNVQFVFAKPSMGHCRYYLNFENTISLQQMLTALKETTDLNFQQDTTRHTITISGKACN